MASSSLPPIVHRFQAAAANTIARFANKVVQLYVQKRRKKRKVGAVSGKGGNAHFTKRQIQEISTDCVATTISAMITVDPQDQEEGPSAMLETASAARGTRSNTRS